MDRRSLDTPRRLIEVRGFKWPRRPTWVAMAHLLGEDEFGRWLGIPKGDPSWFADGSRSCVFEASFVKLVPSGTFWTVCFNPIDPVVDVDIVLPVEWNGDVLEEIDLELDVVRLADGSITVRDQDTFDQVRQTGAMPEDIAAQALQTCDQLRELVGSGAEPFATVGPSWLAAFLSTSNNPQESSP